MIDFAIRVNPAEYICTCGLRCNYGDVECVVPDGDDGLHRYMCLRCGIRELRERSPEAPERRGERGTF